MKIAFVIEHPSARLLKIARELKKHNIEIEGYDLRSIPNYSGVMQCVKEICSEWHEYYNSSQLYDLLKDTNASVIHYFSLWGNCGNVCDILMNKEKLPPIILECYDILNEFYINRDINYPIYKGREKYALANADGAIFRSYCGEYLEKKGYKIPDRTLEFLDYYDGDIVDIDLEASNHDELSLVYVGGLSTEDEWPDSPHACWFELAKLCKKNNTHLHIYPSVWDDFRFQKYIMLDEQNDFFHFHKPLKSDDLIKEIRYYDYGIMPATKELFNKDIFAYYYTPVAIYASTNKYFDYLCAGLPIVGYVGKILVNEFTKDGMAIFEPIEEYDFDSLKRDLIKMKKNVQKNRYKYEMKNHINRLIEFYDSF